MLVFSTLSIDTYLAGDEQYSFKTGTKNDSCVYAISLAKF